jgi:hypothetical protein
MLREIKLVANGLFEDLKGFHQSEIKGMPSPTKR